MFIQKEGRFQILFQHYKFYYIFSMMFFSYNFPFTVFFIFTLPYQFELNSIGMKNRNPFDHYKSDWWYSQQPKIQKIYIISSQKEPKGKSNLGLTNQGSTCFINSALQCLLNIKQLAQYLIEADQEYQTQLNKQIILLAKSMWTKSYTKPVAYDMRKMYQKVMQTMDIYKINRNKQMDSQQFVQNLFNYLNENPLVFPPKHKHFNKKIIKKLFQGYFQTTILCKQQKKNANYDQCNNQSLKLRQMFFSLPLTVISQHQIEERNNNFNIVSRFYSQQKYNVDLITCLNNFSQKTRLTQDRWYCKKCMKETVSQKQMKIQQTGKILIIHLLRFIDDRKFTQKINYPLYIQEADLLQRKKQEGKRIRYRLTGVICHIGYSMKGGHYYSYCYNDHRNKWFKYSDSHVSDTEREQYVSNQDAYVLFYEKTQSKL